MAEPNRGGGDCVWRALFLEEAGGVWGRELVCVNDLEVLVNSVQQADRQEANKESNLRISA